YGCAVVEYRVRSGRSGRDAKRQGKASDELKVGCSNSRFTTRDIVERDSITGVDDLNNGWIGVVAWWFYDGDVLRIFLIFGEVLLILRACPWTGGFNAGDNPCGRGLCGRSGPWLEGAQDAPLRPSAHDITGTLGARVCAIKLIGVKSGV